jgi:hypothetical protein
VGKIGRGVLKRAKMSLDNVKAKVVGVVLNNLSPRVGPDYFKYQTQYYYEPAKPAIQDYGVRVKDTVRKHRRQRLISEDYFHRGVLIVAIALLVIGIFWKDLVKDLIEWTTFGG